MYTLFDIKKIVQAHYENNHKKDKLSAKTFKSKPNPFFRVQKTNNYLVVIPGSSKPILVNKTDSEIKNDTQGISSTINYQMPKTNWPQIKGRDYQAICSQGHFFSCTREIDFKSKIKEHTHNKKDTATFNVIEKQIKRDLRPYCQACKSTTGRSSWYTTYEIYEALRHHYERNNDHVPFPAEDFEKNPENYICVYVPYTESSTSQNNNQTTTTTTTSESINNRSLEQDLVINSTNNQASEIPQDEQLLTKETGKRKSNGVTKDGNLSNKKQKYTDTATNNHSNELQNQQSNLEEAQPVTNP